jgi:hypothetical protein
MAHSIPSPVLDWLLEESNPSVRYRALTELLGKSRRSAVVRESEKAIPDSKLVTHVFSHMDKDGHWPIYHNGPGLEQSGIGLALAELAELGMTIADPRVSAAVDRFFAFRERDVPFPDDEHSCYYTQYIRSLVMLGCETDSRMKSLLDRLRRPCRHDGGFICNRKHRGKNKNTDAKKSCYIETNKAVSAFSELPEFWKSGTCLGLVDYMLRRHVCFRMDNLAKAVFPAAAQIRFPFLLPDGHASLLETIYALARMGYGSDERMKDAWDLLDRSRCEDGKYVLHLANRRSLLQLESKKPDKFATLYAYLATHHR